MNKEKAILREFEYVTRWVIKGGTIKPESSRWEDSSGWIYAFVAASRVMYVGLTTRLLRSRLDDYSYHKDPYLKGGQPDRLRNLIRSSIETGQTIDIYRLRCSDPEKIGAQENALILKYDPPWNKQRPMT